MPSKTTVGLLSALAFATWAVAGAALASLQNQCEDNTILGGGSLAGVEKFSNPMLNCGKIYRYWWYVTAFEVFSIIGLVIANVLGAVRSQRASWAGVFSVLLVLYISMTDAFLTAQDMTISNVSHNSVGRIRTMVAGCIMTSVVNAFIILALGTESAEPEAEKSAEKATI